MISPQKITIIIPTLNCQKNLPKALSSVFSQTYKNIEVLIIDGLSQDDTIIIIKKFSINYPYLKYISERDNGIYDAMNIGISLCTGDWIFFLGCDDSFYDNNVLNDLFNNHQNLEYDIIYGNVVSPLFKGLYDHEFTIDKIYHRNICHQAIFYKSNIFTIKGAFELKYIALADWEYNLRWFLDGQIKKKYIDRIIANYGGFGKSTIGLDSAFMNDKDMLFLKYGKHNLPLDFKYNILKKLVISSLKKRNFLSSSYYIVYYIFIALLRFFRLDFL